VCCVLCRMGLNIWVFILLSEQHKFLDFCSALLHVSAIIRWESWSTKRANRGGPLFTNSGYSIMVTFYDYYYSEIRIINDFFSVFGIIILKFHLN
jgi:hypothetical protein